MSTIDGLTIPPALLAEIQAEADKEHRPASEVLREVIEHGLARRQWNAHADKERQQARELGLPDDDGEPTPEYRQTIREKIAQGLASARACRLVDGDAVFSRIYGELDDLERQGRR